MSKYVSNARSNHPGSFPIASMRYHIHCTVNFRAGAFKVWTKKYSRPNNSETFLLINGVRVLYLCFEVVTSSHVVHHVHWVASKGVCLHFVGLYHLYPPYAGIAIVKWRALAVSWVSLVTYARRRASQLIAFCDCKVGLLVVYRWEIL